MLLLFIGKNGRILFKNHYSLKTYFSNVLQRWSWKASFAVTKKFEAKISSTKPISMQFFFMLLLGYEKRPKRWQLEGRCFLAPKRIQNTAERGFVYQTLDQKHGQARRKLQSLKRILGHEVSAILLNQLSSFNASAKIFTRSSYVEHSSEFI